METPVKPGNTLLGAQLQAANIKGPAAALIASLQAQLNALQAQVDGKAVEYPFKPGDMVLLPADENGKRLVKIVPNNDMAVANLAMIIGVEKYEGEVPKEGFIIDTRTAKVFQSMPAAKVAQPNPEEKPQDFKTNQPTKIEGQARIGAIIGAIGSLKAADFTKGNGYPSVPALSRVLGYDIEGSERDAAWEAFKKSQPNFEPPTE